jgi:hypothetical protein
MTKQDDVRILHNKRDNITYFLHLREERIENVSIARDELDIARQIQNSIIVITILNDKNDSAKGVTFYGLSADKWFILSNPL